MPYASSSSHIILDWNQYMATLMFCWAGALCRFQLHVSSWLIDARNNAIHRQAFWQDLIISDVQICGKFNIVDFVFELTQRKTREKKMHWLHAPAVAYKWVQLDKSNNLPDGRTDRLRVWHFLKSDIIFNTFKNSIFIDECLFLSRTPTRRH